MTTKKPHDHAKPKSWLSRLASLIGFEPKSRDELMTVLHEAEDRELISAETLGMIERIFHVSEMQIREVMVPKAQMVVIHKEATLDTILSTVIESGHSRFPIIDPNDNNIIGMLLAKDLLTFCVAKEASDFNLKSIMRPAVFTPQSKRIDVLLREFRINRNHIAVVLDEYSHVAGIVTIEDLLEQIVGEIEDEYDIDEEDSQIKKHNDQSYVVKANTVIEEFNDYFKSNFNDDSFDTIGGLVLQAFGHLPKRGENVKFGGFRFKVLNADHRRIYLLDVKPLNKK